MNNTAKKIAIVLLSLLLLFALFLTVLSTWAFIIYPQFIEPKNEFREVKEDEPGPVHTVSGSIQTTTIFLKP